MRLLVKGGRIVDPANGIDETMDLLVVDSAVAEIGRSLPEDGAELLDATGKIVCPGFIDIHTHLREPGFEYKEDIASGSRAAAAGGFTTICAMPNTSPVVDNAAVAIFVREKARQAGVVDVLPIGSVTKKQAGEELSEMGELAEAGCVAFSDDGSPVTRSDVMRHALEYARMFGLPILSHCEDLNLSRDGQMHEGYRSTVFGLRGIPAAAEEAMVARDVIMAQLTSGRVHVCHASTAGALDIIRKAKLQGLKVTCEATPHHLVLTDEAVESYDADTKVNPPLRSEEHVEALRRAVADGLVDCIATDHAPHNLESKDCEYAAASFGISGLETAVAVVMDKLVNTGLLSIGRMVELFTAGPARVIGLSASRGTLTPGVRANITILDPNTVRTVDPAKFYSKGKNSPFKGMELRGWPWAAIVAGTVVCRDGVVAQGLR
ncbi:MAG: dihydroorotase [Clostridia bacterium]|nr:dihydroorotase [Clostridia bacterium]